MLKLITFTGGASPASVSPTVPNSQSAAANSPMRSDMVRSSVRSHCQDRPPLSPPCEGGERGVGFGKGSVNGRRVSFYGRGGAGRDEPDFAGIRFSLRYH